MSRPPHRALLALAAGGLCAAATGFPAGPAGASGQVCEGLVIDDGNGGAALVQAAQVAPGSSDLDALGAAGDSVTQNDSGLVCGINGYPANALANCTNTANGLYFYWSYWQGNPSTNTWTYPGIGPAGHPVESGQTYVQGWRYQDPGPASPSAGKPSVSPAAAFAQACPGVTPVAPSSGGGGTSGGGGSGSGSTVTTTAAAPGASSSPTGSTPTPAGSGPSSSGASKTTPPTSASSQTAPASATGPASTAGVGAGQSTTTTTRGAAARTKQRGGASTLALSDTAHSHGAGSDPALPIIVVAVLIALLGGAAWLRWRRRPGEEPGEG
jgi:hypothetical protein